jgi:hypothetical protein
VIRSYTQSSYHDDHVASPCQNVQSLFIHAHGGQGPWAGSRTPWRAYLWLQEDTFLSHSRCLSIFLCDSNNETWCLAGREGEPWKAAVPPGPENLDFMQSQGPTLLELKAISSSTKGCIRGRARSRSNGSWRLKRKGRTRSREKQFKCNQSMNASARVQVSPHMA